MAILSQSTASFSFVSTRTDSTHLTRFPCRVTFRARSPPLRPALVSSRLNSSRSPDAGGSLSPDNGGGDVAYQLHHDFSPQRRRRGSPVFVTLPVNSIGRDGRVARPKAMMFSLKALATAGVEGVVIEIWWGLVEKKKPRVYDWRGYEELVAMACKCGLKVRVVLAFHQHGTGPDDPNWYVLIIENHTFTPIGMW